MPTIQFPTEFSELLTLLNDHDVRYLVVGGYAVTYSWLSANDQRPGSVN